jgi:hypothetical protein
LGATDEEARRRLPWQVAAEQVDAGVPWHARGSLLALHVGLSRLALRRIAQDQPSAPPGLMNPVDERQFHETLPLLEPGDLSDMDRDAIAGAIARGRARLANATSVEALESVVSDVHSLRVDGLRRRALRWTLVNAPTELARWLSLAELAALGAADAPIDRWGMSGLPAEACLCTRVRLDIPRQLLVGQSGLLASNVADLNLRVVETSADMKIPAALGRPILAAVVQTYLDQVRPSDPDDWITLVREAQALTREAVEDSLAGLTTTGALVPVDAALSAEHP